MFNIRMRARLFKAAKNYLQKTFVKSIQKVGSPLLILKDLYKRIKEQIKLLRDWYTNKKPRTAQVILIQKTKVTVKKKVKVCESSSNPKPKKTIKIKDKRKDTAQGLGDPVQDFYREWELGFGPALTSLDKKYFESLDLETRAKVICNARLTLHSPYLKAVYNGLKDLEDISDLIELDKKAQEKVKPTLEDFLKRRPDDFIDFLFIVHDKGIFETRSGERRLSLDPRLVPAWLGLAVGGC